MEAISNISSQSSVASSHSGSSSVMVARQPLVAAQGASENMSSSGVQGHVMSDQAMKDAVAQANQDLVSQGVTDSVSFSYEEKLNQMYVQIRDQATGIVVNEFPSRDVRAAQIAMREMIGLILDKQG